MLNKLSILFSLIALAMLGACECVPEIAGPKQVTPGESADVLFVHAMPDQPRMEIESSGYTVTSEFAYDDDTFDYYQIGAGANNIRLISPNGSTMFNGVVDFSKGMDYTLVMYGGGSKLRTLVMKDQVDGIAPEWAYIRYAHVAGGTGEVKFEVGGDTPAEYQNLTFRNKSEFQAIWPGNYPVRIYNATTKELIIELPAQKIQAGRLYTLVLRGDVSSGSERPIECLIIRTSPPLE
ncbi:MAG: DUF4397 domain-containing protein [Candidatus Kapaibacterium sp.]